MKCKICNKEISIKGMGTHLTNKHNMTSKEYYDKYYKKEDEGICPVCGKPTNFISITKGYHKHCSKKCSTLNKETQKKIKKTISDKYGTEYYFQSDDFKEKAATTNLERYGAENVFASEYGKEKIKETNKKRYGNEVFIQSDTGKKKAAETCLKKYGTEYAIASKPVREKIKQSNLKKYGVENAATLKKTHEKCEQTNLKRYGVKCTFCNGPSRENCIKIMEEKYGYGYPIQIKEFKDKIVQTRSKNIKNFAQENQCVPLSSIILEYGEAWRKDLNIDIIEYKNNKFVKNVDIPKISKYANRSICSSSFEYIVYNYIKSIYKGKIINRCHSQIKNPNTKTVLELDIYIPEKKLAIECNGIFYHSYNFGTDNNYHLMKTKLCEEKGIRLIHISEWEWNNKENICKSIISSALNIYDKRIYARKCSIKEVKIKEAREFLDNNHIQGYVSSSIRLGLYYRDELVQIITLGKSRFKANEYELLRMCTKLNTQIIGGFSKLMKHLPSCINEVISYVDRSKFTGKGYINSGWALIGETKVGYNYYKGNNKYSRQQCQKHKLKEFLGEEKFDNTLSETENMVRNNYLKVYDCGNLKMKWIKRSIYGQTRNK